MKIIAVSGWKQNGKDAIAKYLVDKKYFRRLAFADKLKDMVCEEYNIPREHLDHPEFKEKAIPSLPVITVDDFGHIVHSFMKNEFRTLNNTSYSTAKFDEQLYWTPRALCILKGSVNRAINSRYWVQKVIDEILKECNEPKAYKMFQYTSAFGIPQEPRFVISDLRYKSEVSQLREAFGDKLITIRVNRETTCNSNDPSERDLDNAKFDCVIDNTGSLVDLYNKVDRII